jgi:transposase
MVLLLANKQISIEEIAEFTDSSTSTVKRVTKAFVLYGVENALTEKSRHFKSRKLDEKQQAKLMALACTDPPEGRNKWTLRLLAEKHVDIDENLPIISRETVRRTLKKSNFKPWQKKMWCIPKVTSDFIAKMEHIIDLYNRKHSTEIPLICLDETPVQLIGETRKPIPAKPGQPRKFDYEYRRNGVVNLFVVFDPQIGWRHVEVTDRRTKQDFARFIKKIVDEYYPNAKKIKIVLDNLNTHKMGSLYATYPPEEAARIMKKLEFHHPPPHASWLNMVEIEISRLSK